MRLLLIGLGGAVGTLARFGTVMLLRDVTTRSGFPWGTAVVNIVGCLIIGIAYGVWEDRWLGRDHQLALVVGLLGGYTTFSSYALDAHNLLREGHVWRAVAYVLVNNVVGVAAVVAGYVSVRR